MSLTDMARKSIERRQPGRPPIDRAKRDREERRKTLHRGMLACYEVIDRARKEMADLDAADAAAGVRKDGKC